MEYLQKLRDRHIEKNNRTFEYGSSTQKNNLDCFCRQENSVKRKKWNSGRNQDLRGTQQQVSLHDGDEVDKRGESDAQNQLRNKKNVS